MFQIICANIDFYADKPVKVTAKIATGKIARDMWWIGFCSIPGHKEATKWKHTSAL